MIYIFNLNAIAPYCRNYGYITLAYQHWHAMIVSLYLRYLRYRRYLLRYLP